MWTLIMKLPHTEVKFYPEVKSQTGLSSLRVSCKRALTIFFVYVLRDMIDFPYAASLNYFFYGQTEIKISEYTWV